MGPLDHDELTHWPLEHLDAVLKMHFTILFDQLVSSDFMIIPLDERYMSLLMISVWRHQPLPEPMLTQIYVAKCRH